MGNVIRRNERNSIQRRHPNNKTKCRKNIFNPRESTNKNKPILKWEKGTVLFSHFWEKGTHSKKRENEDKSIYKKKFNLAVTGNETITDLIAKIKKEFNLEIKFKIIDLDLKEELTICDMHLFTCENKRLESLKSLIINGPDEEIIFRFQLSIMSLLDKYFSIAYNLMDYRLLKYYMELSYINHLLNDTDIIKNKVNLTLRTYNYLLTILKNGFKLEDKDISNFIKNLNIGINNLTLRIINLILRSPSNDFLSLNVPLYEIIYNDLIKISNEILNNAEKYRGTYKVCEEKDLLIRNIFKERSEE